MKFSSKLLIVFFILSVICCCFFLYRVVEITSSKEFKDSELLDEVTDIYSDRMNFTYDISYKDAEYSGITFSIPEYLELDKHDGVCDYSSDKSISHVIVGYRESSENEARVSDIVDIDNLTNEDLEVGTLSDFEVTQVTESARVWFKDSNDNIYKFVIKVCGEDIATVDEVLMCIIDSCDFSDFSLEDIYKDSV